MPVKRRRVSFDCPCGGGQSCMVSRRSLGDWVPEDNIFKSADLPIRKNCFSEYTKEQLFLLNSSIHKRWEIDGEQEEL